MASARAPPWVPTFLSDGPLPHFLPHCPQTNLSLRKTCGWSQSRTMGPLPEYLVGMFQNTSLPQIRPQIGQTCGWPTTVIWALARFAAYLPHLPHLPCSTRLHPAPPRLPCFPTFPTCPKLQRGSREGGGESGCKWGKWGKRGKRGKRGKWQKTVREPLLHAHCTVLRQSSLAPYTRSPKP